MRERPKLSTKLEYDTFIKYYYLKEELTVFCRENGLSTIGGKLDLTNRIKHFLKTGEKLADGTVKRKNVTIKLNELSLASIIEENFVCSENHRAFFKEVIGDTFSFNVDFQKYLKSNAGKTYYDAVDEWYKIQKYKRENKGRNKIDSLNFF